MSQRASAIVTQPMESPTAQQRKLPGALCPPQPGVAKEGVEPLSIMGSMMPIMNAEFDHGGPSGPQWPTGHEALPRGPAFHGWLWAPGAGWLVGGGDQLALCS
ncbi:hypothetical protein NHX12_013632 [Muraenolepis orangiensis]|uniref:Uncharacterized protein n=1 Tax=Muraenolepis orangiensis TaxID=630683 RepID=A0A9Q0DAJ2_9TELE|nr:hypothetical protein NHX12_013632 [Muraenolepis orangiensis]